MTKESEESQLVADSSLLLALLLKMSPEKRLALSRKALSN